ncbi:hypothetical protein [uncultured Martelella sp.]|uniref:hypothetical protein n=1 Tax=uncultured Martelella sp. TaxID=392331 RepID=UPI0029C632EE|nr:hypothetical protein [uncultured Martelella sp.]
MHDFVCRGSITIPPGVELAGNGAGATHRILITADDGRPCSMEAFVTALLQEVEDNALLRSAIRAWLTGDWQAALSPLPDHALAGLTDRPIMRFRARSRRNADVIDEASGDHAALEAFTRRWSHDANITVEVRHSGQPWIPATWKGGAA